MLQRCRLKARIIAQIVDVQTNEPVGRLAVDGNAITIYRGLSGDDTVIEESRRITDVGEALTGLLSGKPNDNEDQAASAGSEYTVLQSLPI